MRARGAVGAAIGPSIRYGLETLRRDIPIGIRAEAAGLADEHRAGLFVALELPERPARRDVRELAAARVKERRAVPSAATLSTAILPLSGEPSRAFSLSAQSTAVRKSSTFACRRGAPSIAAVATTRKPWEATVVRKPVNALLSIAQPPLPQTSTGSV